MHGRNATNGWFDFCTLKKKKNGQDSRAPNHTGGKRVVKHVAFSKDKYLLKTFLVHGRRYK